jgi:hypothetical protein
MERVTRFITEKLKLKVNQQKSAVARPWERKFLGFSFTNAGAPKRRIAPKAVGRFKERIRELTSRTRGVSTERIRSGSVAHICLPCRVACSACQGWGNPAQSRRAAGRVSARRRETQDAAVERSPEAAPRGQILIFTLDANKLDIDPQMLPSARAGQEDYGHEHAG